MNRKYEKRDQRHAEIAAAVRKMEAAPPPEPKRYTCSVCGVEHSETSPIYAVSKLRPPTVLFCAAHLPKEWWR